MENNINIFSLDDDIKNDAIFILNNWENARVKIETDLKSSGESLSGSTNIFLFETPKRFLMKVISTDKDKFEISAAIGDWYTNSVTFLTKFLKSKNKSKFILIDAGDCLETELRVALPELYIKKSSENMAEFGGNQVLFDDEIIEYGIQTLINQDSRLSKLQCDLFEISKKNYEDVELGDVLLIWREKKLNFELGQDMIVKKNKMIRLECERILNETERIKAEAATNLEIEIEKNKNLQSISDSSALKDARILELGSENSELKNENFKLDAKCKSVNSELHELRNELATIKSETELLYKELQTANTLLKDLESTKNENKLILTQFNQIKVEYENLLASHSVEVNQLLESRANVFKTLFDANLGLVYFERSEIFNDPASECILLIVQKIKSVAFEIEQIKFKLLVKEGVLGLIYEKSNASSTRSLLKWPRGLENIDIIDFRLGGSNDRKYEIKKFVENISTSDWMLLNNIPNFILNSSGVTSTDFTKFDLKKMTHRLKKLLKHIPPIFRFNKLELKNIQVNKDYEHLWFVFHDVSYADIYKKNFEIRVAASCLLTNNFEDLPKLEFPCSDESEPPFDSWYCESVDDFGKKFEIRFDLTKGICDKNVISRISENDLRFILEALNCLKNEINHFESTTIIDRDWKHWDSVVNKMFDIFAL